ncbi:hypothetical protein DL96DRAFT_1669924 [Flagelloscypha sp. PMI_526]|nr:hypothetical protein DL96DRAFT_1669924 [Flagelloscypha sp. PMI_526]
MSNLGLPLLSGPPPESTAPEGDACRKCAKEFNILIARSRRCQHCGYYYCHSCTDYQALMPRRAPNSNGYDMTHVCAFCIEVLNVTAAGRSQLKAMSLSKLNKYMNSYGIKMEKAVEKDDLVNAIMNIRQPNGCLPSTNESFYRKFSVPSRSNDTRPRGFFSRLAGDRPPPPPVQPTPSANFNSQRTEFARPDLAPDHPMPAPPTPPRATPQPQAQQARPPPPQQTRPTPRPSQYHAQQGYQPQYMPRPPNPSTRPTPTSSPYTGQGGSRSTHNLHSTPPPQPNSTTRPAPAPAPPTTPPRPRNNSNPSPPTIPPPALDDLLNMTTSAISTLPISTLKAILYNNRVHMSTVGVVEKSDLVKKVMELVDDERRERARRKEEEEREERELKERMDAARNELHQDQKKEKSEEEKAKMRAELEKTGLCVICQDDEANIAIVDCGHMAMCKDCSDAVMKSTKECPLCRTRIVTEQRLLRIYRT